MAKRVARPIDEWPQGVLLARARKLVYEIDPDRPIPHTRSLRRQYWLELREIVVELDRRGLQGRLV